MSETGIGSKGGTRPPGALVRNYSKPNPSCHEKSGVWEGLYAPTLGVAAILSGRKAPPTFSKHDDFRAARTAAGVGLGMAALVFLFLP